MYLCRTCGGICNSSRSFKQIFIPRNRSLLTQIKLITGLELKQISGLPYHMCKKCYEDMNIAIMFRKKCIESEKMFMAMHWSSEDRILNSVLSPILKKEGSVLEAVFNPRNSTKKYVNKRKKSLAKPNVSSSAIIKSELDLGEDDGGASGNSQMKAVERLTAPCFNETKSLIEIKTEVLSSDDDEYLNQSNHIKTHPQIKPEIDSCDDYQNLIQCKIIISEPIDIQNYSQSTLSASESNESLEFMDIQSNCEPFDDGTENSSKQKNVSLIALNDSYNRLQRRRALGAARSRAYRNRKRNMALSGQLQIPNLRKQNEIVCGESNEKLERKRAYAAARSKAYRNRTKTPEA